MENQDAAKPKRKLFTRKRVFYVCGTFFVLAVATIFLLPFAIREGIEYGLRTQGHANPHVEDVYFNPFTATLIVNGISGGHENEDFIEVGHVHFVLDWFALLRRNVRVKTIILEDISIYVRQDESFNWRVGSVDVADLPTNVKTYELFDLPIGVGAESVALRNIEIVFQNWDVHATGLVEQGSISGLRTWTAATPAPFELVMKVNGSPVRISGTTTPFDDSATLSLSMAIESLPLDSLSTMASGFGVKELAGSVDGDFKAEVTFQLAEQTIDASITGQSALAAIAVAYDSYRGQSDAIAWDGRVTLTGELTAPDIHTDGTLKVTNASFSESSKNLSLESGAWKGVAGFRIADALSVTASGELAGNDIAARGLDDLFTEAKVDTVGVAIEQMELDTTEPTRFAIAAIRTETSNINLDGVTGGAGRVTFTSAELEGTSVAVDMQEDLTTVTAAITGRIRELNAVDFAPEVHEASISEGQVTLTELRVEASGSSLKITSQADLRGSTVNAVLVDQPASAAAAAVNGTLTFAIETADAGEVLLQTQGSAESSELVVTNTDTGAEVLRLAKGVIQGLAAESIDKVTIASAELHQPRLLQRPGAAGAGDAYVASVGTVTVEQIALDNTRAVVESILVDGFSGYVVVTEDGEIEALTLVNAFLSEDTEAETVDSSPAEPVVLASAPASSEPAEALAFSARANLIELRGDTRIQLEDRSVTPAASLEIRELIAKLQNLDTETPDTMAPISVEAVLGETSRLRVSGDAAPLAAAPSAVLQAQIQSLDLLGLTGYSQRNVGYKIDSGVFSADCDIKIDNGQLKTENNLLINHLALTKLKADELTEMDNQLGMPVNAAVNLLRDGEGNISLTVPVEGDLNDPQIKIAQVIRKAMSGAMKKGVLTVFAPLRLLGKGKDDASLDDGLQFKEVPFESASTKYDPASVEYLDEIAKIMKKHPGVSLQLRGVAGGVDREAFALTATAETGNSAAVTAAPKASPPLVPTAEAEKYAPPLAPEATETPPPAPVIPDERLIQLADERAQVVKSYLVDTAGIEPTRLFIAESTVDPENTDPRPPRVEIGL